MGTCDLASSETRGAAQRSAHGLLTALYFLLLGESFELHTATEVTVVVFWFVFFCPRVASLLQFVKLVWSGTQERLALALDPVSNATYLFQVASNIWPKSECSYDVC